MVTHPLLHFKVDLDLNSPDLPGNIWRIQISDTGGSTTSGTAIIGPGGKKKDIVGKLFKVPVG